MFHWLRSEEAIRWYVGGVLADTAAGGGKAGSSGGVPLPIDISKLEVKSSMYSNLFTVAVPAAESAVGHPERIFHVHWYLILPIKLLLLTVNSSLFLSSLRLNFKVSLARLLALN